MSYLAIDIGTSFIKGAILDTRRAASRTFAGFPFPSLCSALASRGSKSIRRPWPTLCERLWPN